MTARSRRVALALSVTIPGLGLALAACGGTGHGSTLADQVAGWAQTTGFSSQVATVQGDLRRIEASASGRSPASLKTDCDVLVTDTLAANQNLPTPDQTLTALLSTAYSAAGVAGRDCFTGVGTTGDLPPRSRAEATTAGRDLIKASARFDAVTVGAGS